MTDNSDAITEWNGPLGQRWAEQKALFDNLTGPFGQAALNAAQAQAGEHILDIGCGCGETSFALAHAVGAAGSVLGVDISKPMLDTARGLAASGPANLQFQEADASTTALPSGQDLLFSRFGVMFFDHPAPAFAHLRKALKPTGRAAFCCWRTPQENPWASTPMMAARQALNITAPPPPATTPGPFAFGNADRLRGILTEAGFTQINIQPFDAPVHLGDTPAKAADHTARFGPAGRLIRDVGEEHLPTALAAIEAAVAPFADANGVVALPGAVWIVTAKAG